MSTTDNEQPTETTALLANRTPSQRSRSRSLPLIEPVIVQIQVKGIESCTTADFCPTTLARYELEVAFSLVVLFELRSSLRPPPEVTSSDIWNEWRREQDHTDALRLIDSHIVHTWNEYVAEERTVDEIEETLWHPFILNDASERSRRAVDYLSGTTVPEGLLSHPLVYLSFRKIWKSGCSVGDETSHLVSRLLLKIEAICTPRVLHLADLFLLLCYLFVLVYFLILPPTRSLDITQSVTAGPREVALLVYSCTRLLPPLSLSPVPFLLVVLAFLTHIPSTPFPDDFAYGVLLFAFSWIFVELHSPVFPSPLHLLPSEQFLPLAVLFRHGMSRICIPTVTFFLPALALSLLLLSTSLYDIFSEDFAIARVIPAPIEARMGFLALFTVMFLLMVCSLIMLVLIYPSLASEHSLSRWDRYSKPIGLEARQAFIRLVVAYSTPYSFPPPLNLIQFMAQISTAFLGLIGSPESIRQAKSVERALWWIVMVPIMLIFASVWLWGLWT